MIFEIWSFHLSCNAVIWMTFGTSYEHSWTILLQMFDEVLLRKWLFKALLTLVGTAVFCFSAMTIIPKVLNHLVVRICFHYSRFNIREETLFIKRLIANFYFAKLLSFDRVNFIFFVKKPYLFDNLFIWCLLFLLQLLLPLGQLWRLFLLCLLLRLFRFLVNKGCRVLLTMTTWALWNIAALILTKMTKFEFFEGATSQMLINWFYWTILVIFGTIELLNFLLRQR